MALAFDRTGSGPPLLLLHGTNSSRRVWRPVLAPLAAHREVIAVDLPAHGESPPTSYAPPGFARDVATLLDALGNERVAIVGHSSGGWTSLELAKLGRATGVLALVPAGLWLRRSPLVTDIGLVANWRLGQLLGPSTAWPLRSRTVRRLTLGQLSARPADVAAQDAIGTALAAIRSRHFPEHFRQTRRQRFLSGRRIGSDVPVHVVWGHDDHIARRQTSWHTDQLPAHAVVQTWSGCGHMVMWDRPADLVRAALALPA